MRTNSQRRFLVGSCAVAIALAVSGEAVAAPVAMGFQLSLAPDVQLYSGAPSNVWNTGGLVSGTFQDDLGVVKYKMVASNASNSFVWTDNLLDQDLSGAAANATFLGGGSISVTGVLKRTNNSVAFDSSLHAGAPILVGTVSAFKVRETGPGDDVLESYDTLIHFTATGGYLYDTADLTQVRGVYDFSFNASNVQQMQGGPLVNFANDLVSTTTSVQITFTGVPEPSVAAFVAVGMCLIVRRRGTAA